MKNLLLLIAGLSVLLLWSENAAAQKVLRPSPHWPLDVGNSWTYRAGSQKIVMRVTKHEEVDGVTCAVVEAVTGQTKRTEHVTTQKDGIYRYMADEKKITPPLLLLKLPAKSEDTWEIDTKMNGTEVKGTFTVGEEEISVPKGKFKTMTVSSEDFQIGGRSMSLKYWFAANVGMVKQELQIAGVILTLELHDYKVAE